MATENRRIFMARRQKDNIDTLISQIKESETLGRNVKAYLIDYVKKYREGKIRKYNDDRILDLIINQIISDGVQDNVDVDKYYFGPFNEVYPRMISYNLDYFRSFIDIFTGVNKGFSKNLFRDSIYSMFSNKVAYLDVMRIILSDAKYYNNIDIIGEYFTQVGKYCIDEYVFNKDCLSYLAGFHNFTGDDFRKYNEQELAKAKSRIGIYNLSAAEIASIDHKIHTIEGMFERINIFIETMKNEREALERITRECKNDLQTEGKQSVEKLRVMIESLRQEMVKKLDDYVTELEVILKDKSDATFQEILKTYQDQVKEVRDLFRGYSESTTKDFLAVQKASEDTVRQLKEYVSNEPKLRELLTRVQEEGDIHQQLVKLVSLSEEERKALYEKAATENGDKEKEAEPEPERIIVPGYEKRIMLPYEHLVLPSEVSKTINPLFDESIPFKKREEELDRRIEEHKKNGVLFHKKFKQICIDMMEGDWPYLWGPSGTGKSYLMGQVADVLGMRMEEAGKITEPHSLIGYNDPMGRFQITPTFVAVLFGYILLLDEFDANNADTAIILNGIYSKLLKKINKPDKPQEVTFGTDVKVDVNPNFRMASCGNTDGEGQNEDFSSRSKQDESVQERVTPIYIDYDDNIERGILRQYPDWVEFIINFRNACLEYAAEEEGKETAKGIATTRDAEAIRKYLLHNSKSLDQILSEKFIQIKPKEYLLALARKIASEYDIDYERDENPSFNREVSKATGKIIAKRFVYNCKHGVK